jgi:hypothetical protein
VVSYIKKDTNNFIQGNLMEIEWYRVEFQKLKVPAQTRMDRATKMAKIEAFDYWMMERSKQKSKSQPK